MVTIREVIRLNTHNNLMLFDLPGCNVDNRNGQWAYEVNGYHVIVSIRIVVSIRIAYNERSKHARVSPSNAKDVMVSTPVIDFALGRSGYTLALSGSRWIHTGPFLLAAVCQTKQINDELLKGPPHPSWLQQEAGSGPSK